MIRLKRDEVERFSEMQVQVPMRLLRWIYLFLLSESTVSTLQDKNYRFLDPLVQR
jgi:hypothetical protein